MLSAFPTRSGPKTASQGGGSGTAPERNNSGTEAQESMPRALWTNMDIMRRTARGSGVHPWACLVANHNLCAVVTEDWVPSYAEPASKLVPAGRSLNSGLEGR